MSPAGARIRASIAYSVMRAGLALPDAFVGRLVGFASFVFRLFGGDERAYEAMRDARSVFLTDPRGAMLVRRMVRDVDRRRLVMILRGRFLP
ncbi:hypothetical protein K8I61_12725 [bacterium]|nr:hypothetical protein [bacterium]